MRDNDNRITLAQHAHDGDLDDIDMRILFELRANGRIKNIDLARRVGLTAAPCLRRTRTLEKAGYVRGYHANLDPKKFGFEVMGFVFVQLRHQTHVSIKQFEDSVRDRSNVRVCVALSGDTDFLLKCVARDADAFQQFVDQTVATPGVKAVTSAIVIGSPKK